MSSINYLDKTGLTTLWGKIKALVPTKTSDLTNDSGFVTTDTNTTYTVSMSGRVITLTGSNGSTSSVTLPVYDGSVTSS